MDREDEGGKPGRQSERVTAFRRTGQSPCQEPTDDEEEDHRIRGVQEEIGQMIPDGIHAPEQVVQAEGHPGQRNVVAQVRGPHPAEVSPPEPPIVRVVEEIFSIVPAHKLVLQRGQEGSEGRESNHQWDHGVLELEPARPILAAHCLLLGPPSPAGHARKKAPPAGSAPGRNARLFTHLTRRDLLTEADYFALTAEEQSAMWRLANAVRQRIERELHPGGYNLGVNVGPAAGRTVGHVHIHLIPDTRATWTIPAAGSARSSRPKPATGSSVCRKARAPEVKTPEPRVGPYTLLPFGPSCLLEVLAVLHQLALLSESQAQVAVGKRIVGLDAQGLPEMVDRLGQLALLGKLNAPVGMGKGIVRLNAQGLPIVFDRLGRLALLSERVAPVVVGVGVVRLEAQSFPVVFDRLGQPALLGKHSTYVVVGVSIVRVEAQGRLVMLHRLSQLALLSEHQAPAVLTDGGSGINRNGMAPEFLRVVPDVDLVPGEDSQPDDDT